MFAFIALITLGQREFIQRLTDMRLLKRGVRCPKGQLWFRWQEIATTVFAVDAIDATKANQFAIVALSPNSSKCKSVANDNLFLVIWCSDDGSI